MFSCFWFVYDHFHVLYVIYNSWWKSMLYIKQRLKAEGMHVMEFPNKHTYSKLPYSSFPAILKLLQPDQRCHLWLVRILLYNFMIWNSIIFRSLLTWLATCEIKAFTKQYHLFIFFVEWSVCVKYQSGIPWLGYKDLPHTLYLVWSGHFPFKLFIKAEMTVYSVVFS